MKFEEINAAVLRQSMPSVWAIVRNWCSDDEDAVGTITMALENFVYDVEQGDSHYRALDTALNDIGIEPDYSEELYTAILNLNLLEDNKEEDDDDEFSDIDALKFIEEHIIIC